MQLIELLRSHSQFWEKGESEGEGNPKSISLESLQLFNEVNKKLNNSHGDGDTKS